MLKRLYVYYHERYPIFARLILGLIVFGEIYFIVLLNRGVTKFDITYQELIGCYTVFALCVAIFSNSRLSIGYLMGGSVGGNVPSILITIITLFFCLKKKMECKEG